MWVRSGGWPNSSKLLIWENKFKDGLYTAAKRMNGAKTFLLYDYGLKYFDWSKSEIIYVKLHTSGLWTGSSVLLTPFTIIPFYPF